MTNMNAGKKVWLNGVKDMVTIIGQEGNFFRCSFDGLDGDDSVLVRVIGVVPSNKKGADFESWAPEKKQAIAVVPPEKKKKGRKKKMESNVVNEQTLRGHKEAVVEPVVEQKAAVEAPKGDIVGIPEDVDYKKAGEFVYADLNETDRKGVRILRVRGGRLFYINEETGFYSAMLLKKAREAGIKLYRK